MANPEHVAKLREGVKAWNKWRDQNPRVAPDLSGSILGEATVTVTERRRPDLAGINFADANLSSAHLESAFLVGACLVNANLDGAYLMGALLAGADMTNAVLRGAQLQSTVLTRARLEGADLEVATLGDTIFADTDLSHVSHLGLCFHRSGSFVDHRTLMKSGSLPLPFIRGVGLPDALIEYMPSLLDQPAQFYSCFISYSTADQAFADRLYADLQNKGVRCWFAPHDMKRGAKVHEQIDDAIRRYDKLLLILSESSMKSNWVRTEIANARRREEDEGHQMLFPVALVPFDAIRKWKCPDGDTGIDSAREIREYLIADFSRWKDHDAYVAEFEKLVRDLKAEARTR